MPRPAAAIPVLVLALVVAGCGGGGGGTDDREQAAAATTSTTVATTPPSTTTTVPTTTTTAPVDPATLRPPTPVADPAALAERIGSAEATLRNPASGPGDIATAALAQQAAYRQLGDHPEWDAAVLAALPPDLQGAVQSHAAARRELRALARRPADSMPAWRIVAPAPADQLVAWYHEAEAAYGVPWQVLAAVNLVETGMGRIRGTSTAGAQGPMQFMPSTWAAYGEGDINDPHQAILAAAHYLQANGAPGDLAGALWHYNHSDHYVRGVQLYADLIAEHPGAFVGFYDWGIWYWTTQGDLYLPIGYEATESIPVEQYTATAPR
jgi:membrane-bound lytic murein transglycosylase B